MHFPESLNPQPVWHFFSEVAGIPRPSKHEERIIAYLLQFAEERHLVCKKDAVGNVLISKPAYPGNESKHSVVLQSHVDMVCEKNSDTKHDFLNDPIHLKIEDQWVKAEGTTLGADDGIGVAAMLAILDDPNINHGPLECLFTIDEETGLTGAFELSPGFFSGKTLINLDSEDEGELFIGCAGGIDTQATFTFEHKKPAGNGRAYTIGITGLKGGHSGDEIHLGLGNAIRIMTDFLLEASRLFDAGVHRFEGGNLKNAIPRESFATIVINTSNENKFHDFTEKFRKSLYESFSGVEPQCNLKVETAPLPEFVVAPVFQKKLLEALKQCPNGVIDWSQSIPGLVETSTNLASIKFIENCQVLVVTSQRSSVDKAKNVLARNVAEVFSRAGATVSHSKGYPGWEPDVNSDLLKHTRDIYVQLFGEQPKIKAIHAGLECGLFLEKYPGLDMISFGPTIKGAHSPDERLLIPSVQKFWDLLLEVLKKWN